MKYRKIKPVISIFCDHTADGLWLDGAAIDTDYLKNKTDFPAEFIERVEEPLIIWQKIYEGDSFYTLGEGMNYNSARFKTFEKLGELIFEEFLGLDQDEFIIEYLDERTSLRRREI